MKIGIVGSRNLNISTKFIIETLKDFPVTEIISGGARGVDTKAKRVAELLNIPCKEFLPEYKEFGRIAPLIRNETIVDNSDLIFAFWDQKSRGTQNTLSIAKRRKKQVILFTF